MLPAIIKEGQAWRRRWQRLVDHRHRKPENFEPHQLQELEVLEAQFRNIQTLERIHDLLGSLSSAPPEKPWWHIDAASLFELYRWLVGCEAGASDDGPAVRFLQLALRRIGHRKLEPRAIATALRRMPDDGGRLQLMLRGAPRIS